MKILIVDDNKEITELFETTLTSKGHSVKVSNDGKEGLDLIKKNESDLVLLDLAIPNFSGRDILTELKKEGPIEPYNIYLFTASVISDTEIEDLVKLGVSGCLRKPIRLDDLISMLEQHQARNL